MHVLMIICLPAVFCPASQAAELDWADELERSVPTYLDDAIAYGDAMPRLHSLLVSRHVSCCWAVNSTDEGLTTWRM
jgi:hypothetical protein